MRRRVVVTGLGCVSPVGNTVAESWANLLAGRSGIANITQFDASNFACKFAGEVKGFNIADHALSLYAHCTKNPCPHKPRG